MTLCLYINGPEAVGDSAGAPLNQNSGASDSWPPFLRVTWLRRQVILFPFNIAVALWCVYSGVMGIFAVGPVADTFYRVLGNFSVPFNVGFAIAGLSMYFGVALTRRNLEAFGLILIISSLAIRSTALLWAAGIDPVLLNQYVLNSLVVSAAIARLISLWKHYYVIEIVAKHDPRSTTP